MKIIVAKKSTENKGQLRVENNTTGYGKVKPPRICLERF